MVYCRPEDLDRLLQSEAFLAGIGAAVRKTHDSGYETLFRVFQRREGSVFVFDEKISVGGTDSVAVDTIADKRHREEYLSNAKKTIERLAHTRQERELYMNMILNTVYPHIPFPNSGQEVLAVEDTAGHIPYVDFHTHPQKLISCPSLEDLQAYNNIRKQERAKGRNVSPLAVIAACPEFRGINDLLFLKEIATEPLTQDEITRCQKALETALYIHGNNTSIDNTTCDTIKEAALESVSPYYAFTSAVFDAQNQQILNYRGEVMTSNDFADNFFV